jgi:hypothetical protein
MIKQINSLLEDKFIETTLTNNKLSTTTNFFNFSDLVNKVLYLSMDVMLYLRHFTLNFYYQLNLRSI